MHAVDLRPGRISSCDLLQVMAIFDELCETLDICDDQGAPLSLDESEARAKLFISRVIASRCVLS